MENEVKNEVTMKPSGGLMFVLWIIALALIVTAVGTGFLGLKIYRDIEKEEAAKLAEVYTPSLSEREIGLAQNTLYDNGVVSSIINNCLLQEEWEFFETNTGKYIVQVTGTVENPSKFLKAINSGRTRFLIDAAIYDYRNSDVEEISCRIQFVKNLGEASDNSFNTYRLSYDEYTIRFKDDEGQERTDTVYGNMEDMFDIMEAYLQDTSL